MMMTVKIMIMMPMITAMLMMTVHRDVDDDDIHDDYDAYDDVDNDIDNH